MNFLDESSKRSDDERVQAIGTELRHISDLDVGTLELSCHLGAVKSPHQAIGISIPPNVSVVFFHICKGKPFLAFMASPDSEPQVHEFPIRENENIRQQAETILEFISSFRQNINEVSLSQLRENFSVYLSDSEFMHEVARYMSETYMIDANVQQEKCHLKKKKTHDVINFETESLLSTYLPEMSSLHICDGKGYCRTSEGGTWTEIDWFSRGDPLAKAEEIYAWVENWNEVTRSNRDLMGNLFLDGEDQN